MQIDTKKNEPRIFENKKIDWEHQRGTQVTLEIEGRYQKGRASVDEYLEQMAIANPHVRLVYHAPEGETREYPRTIQRAAAPAEGDQAASLRHRVRRAPANAARHQEPLALGVPRRRFQPGVPARRPGDLQDGEALAATRGRATFTATDAEALYKAIQSTKIMAPPSNCISPIGEKAILHGLYKQIKGEFYTAVTRPPAVYRGNPFIIEAGLAFGKGPEQAAAAAEAPAVPLAEGEERRTTDELARVIRYANRVPLLYQQSACATFKAALETAWRNYGVAQSRGALPAGPMVIFVHMASVWVPFTSESKEAIADYDEIRKEIKLALQECGRRLGVFLRRRERAKSEFRRRNIFELYIEEVVEACARLKGGKLPKEKLKAQLQKIAAKRTGGARRPTRSWARTAARRACRTRSSSRPKGPRARRRSCRAPSRAASRQSRRPRPRRHDRARQGQGRAAQRAKAPVSEGRQGQGPAANGKAAARRARRRRSARDSEAPVTAKRPAAKRKKR